MTESSRKKVIGMIPARYQSRRFPGKPLEDISGKSLIQRTYENAKQCTALEDLVVLTDDSRIFSHVEGFGGHVVMTSPECPTGTERIAEAIQKYSEFADVEIVVNVQGDEPFLEPNVIEAVTGILLADPEAMMSTAAVKITSQEEAKDYSVVKCVMDQEGHALYFSRTLIPNGHEGQWQPNIDYYKHLGIYAYRRELLLHYADLSPTPLQQAEDLEQLKVLEHGYCIKVAIVESQSLGIDTPEDLKKAEKRL